MLRDFAWPAVHAIPRDYQNIMTILLDVSRLIWRIWEDKLPTGIDRTCLAYVAHFGDRAQAVVQRGGVARVLAPALSRDLFATLLTQGDGKTGGGLRAMALRGLAQMFKRRDKVGEHEGSIYINVGHTGLDRPGHGDWVQRSGVRAIYFLHDLIPLTHPEYCRPGEPAKHVRRVASVMKHGAGVIANSADTLSNLADFLKTDRSAAFAPTVIAPLGAELAAGQADASSLSAPVPADPYFLMLGTIEGRKNHLLMLNVWAEMARKLGPKCPTLVIIGKRGWECEQAVDILDRCEIIRGKVIELPRCDDAQLEHYMRRARALVFPSFVEGYGLPLVEALFCGTPVIASNLGVFKELAGDVPDYFSPIDGLGWTNSILSYAATESPARDAQLARMQGWVAPTWGAHFAKVDAWLEQFRAVDPRVSNRLL